MGWLHRMRARRRFTQEERERLANEERREKERHAIWWSEERERLLARWKRGSPRHLISVARKPNGRVFIDTYFEIANGPSAIHGPPLVLQSMDDARQLGEAVLEGLAVSYRRILPERNLRIHRPQCDYPRARQAKTWSEYRRHVTMVDVTAVYEEQIEEITLTPNHNMGRSSSVPISEAAFTITYESAEQLGRAVQEAMTKATTV